MQAVEATFAKDQSSGVIDLRTGEDVRPRLFFAPAELWASAVTGVPLRSVERIVGQLQPMRGEIICFWRIPAT
jgi:hypothetical protein